jgi:hypothetical protein
MLGRQRELALAEELLRRARTRGISLDSRGQQNRCSVLTRLDMEQANIRVALEFAVQHDSEVGGFEIIGALWLWCWFTFREARRWVEELRVLPGAYALTVARAKALNAAPILAWGDGDTTAARRLAQ